MYSTLVGETIGLVLLFSYYYSIFDVHFHFQGCYLFTGDRRQARHFYLAKQFCFLDADCLVVGESQGSSRRSVGKYPVKPPYIIGLFKFSMKFL